jgi:hypothetical protein
MMWNLKYSSMHAGGMMGSIASQEDAVEMPIDPAEAVALAEAYLSRELPGLNADEHADPFYGYYTIHTKREGVVVGMLSVNGFTGQVFPHTWHGTLLGMSGGDSH